MTKDEKRAAMFAAIDRWAEGSAMVIKSIVEIMRIVTDAWLEDRDNKIKAAIEAERKIIGQQMREWGNYGVWDYYEVEGIKTIDTVESMSKFAAVIEDGAYQPTSPDMWQE